MPGAACFTPLAAKRTIGLFRLSEFTLRLPALIACAAYLYIIRDAGPVLASRFSSPSRPFALGWFSTATPHSIALVLHFCGAGPWHDTDEPRRALYCGLAVAASPVFAMPLAVLAVWQILRNGIPFVERIAIPAVTTAFVLSDHPAEPRRPHSAVRRSGAGKRPPSEPRLRSLRNRGPFAISRRAVGPAAGRVLPRPLPPARLGNHRPRSAISQSVHTALRAMIHRGQSGGFQPLASRSQKSVNATDNKHITVWSRPCIYRRGVEGVDHGYLRQNPVVVAGGRGLAFLPLPRSRRTRRIADDQQRGVARISLINGEVSVKRGDAAEWVAGVVNAPLLSDDRISTAPNSRAEVAVRRRQSHPHRRQRRSSPGAAGVWPLSDPNRARNRHLRRPAAVLRKC